MIYSSVWIKFIDDHLPSDINECLMTKPPCEQDCTNTVGSYTCQCREGFEVNPVDPTKCDGKCDSNRLSFLDLQRCDTN